MDEKEPKTILTLDGEEVKSPRISELKSRKCSCLELQVALVHLIELYEKSGKNFQDAIHSLESTRSENSQHDMMNRQYTI